MQSQLGNFSRSSLRRGNIKGGCRPRERAASFRKAGRVEGGVGVYNAYMALAISKVDIEIGLSPPAFRLPMDRVIEYGEPESITN